MTVISRSLFELHELFVQQLHVFRIQHARERVLSPLRDSLTPPKKTPIIYNYF